MTIEEAIQLANNGNMGAAIGLGDYYWGQKEYDEAEKWYQPAAEQDIIYAIHMMVYIGLMHGYAGMAVANSSSLPFVRDDWEIAYKWITKELSCLESNNPGSEEINRQEVQEHMFEISYNLALCYYKENNYKKTIELISGYQDSRSKILLGVALVGVEDFANALKAFEGSVQDRNYDPCKHSSCEEGVYAIAIVQTSRLYKITNDLDHAVIILQYGLDAVKEEKNKNYIAKELTHYRKKLFDGYTYIE